jgi:protein involved in polysaccharide export with SLBB domain
MLSLDISGTNDPDEIQTKLASFQIRDRDEIHIFPIATFNQDAVYLQGHVLRSGRYSYKPGMKLTDLISSYADLLPEPATKYGEIIRMNPPDYHLSVESFDLGAALSNPAAAPKLQPLDTVRIFSRFDFENPPTVSVNGAVRRPGTFQTSGQIHFREALQLSGGVTPDASMDSAQIIRIMPDSSLKILSVSLKGALEGDPINNVLLQPRDRILVQPNPIRVDPPTVQIQGEVANPGRYPLTGNLRVSDMIRVAGGFKRSAYTESADLTRFNPSAGENKMGEHVEVNIAAAVANDDKQDLPLRDGDVLTIRQILGWKDIGASVTLQGEFAHPGTYGIQPGEHISSVIQRAGGFTSQAYVNGAALRRPEVRELEDASRTELIQRIQSEQSQLKATLESDPNLKVEKDAAIDQLQIMLERVESTVSAGRMVVRISSNTKQWEGTPNDVVVRDGDSLTVPKMPNFVLVNGAVYNQTAITYRPGRSTDWYLAQAGGPTQLADKKAIFVIRADGSIIGHGKSSSGWWGGGGGALRPGDMVVVPEKALGPNTRWRTAIQSLQTVSSIATSAAIAAKF